MARIRRRRDPEPLQRNRRLKLEPEVLGKMCPGSDVRLLRDERCRSVGNERQQLQRRGGGVEKLGRLRKTKTLLVPNVSFEKDRPVCPELVLAKRLSFINPW
jgi:hypothetical protein